MKGRSLRGLVVLAAFAVGAVALRLLIERPLEGSIRIGWPDASVAAFRWGAIGAGSVIGASLAVAGVMLQCLLRNPLASPFTLGISSGAGVGVMVGLYVTWLTGGVMTTPAEGVIPAILGSLTTLLLVWGLGYRRGSLDPLSLVLAGVVLSALGGAVIMLLQHLVPHGLRGDLVLWMMGRVPERPDRAVLIVSTIAALACIGLAWRRGGAMDVAALGDDEVWSVGVHLGRLRAQLLIASGVLTAGAVALAGPIAFVGLLAPHGARLLVGARHRVLTIGAVLAGIILVVGADAARQLIDLGGGRIPVGVFTAALGGPAFLWLLHRGPSGGMRT